MYTVYMFNSSFMPGLLLFFVLSSLIILSRVYSVIPIQPSLCVYVRNMYIAMIHVCMLRDASLYVYI